VVRAGDMSQQINYELELPSDFTDYEWEVESKGWFDNVGLSFNGKRYKLSFYDPARLNQEAEDEIYSSSYFFEQNLIVIRSVNAKNMRTAIENLISAGQVTQLRSEQESDKNQGHIS